VRELVQAIKGRLPDPHTSLGLFGCGSVGRLDDLQAADERREGQPLADQDDQGDNEGEEDQ
jgi:hypothetical protein